MGICYIIGSVPAKVNIIKSDGDLIIAADGGMDNLRASGIVPDIVVGDMDSVSENRDFGDAKVILYPVEKDETDSALALTEGIARGYTKFVFFGCIGGLLDHTMANIALLKGITENGYTAVFADEEMGACAITGRTLNFSKKAVGRISVLSITEKAENVTISGLKYHVDNITLNASVPLGVSNDFVGKDAFVKVSDGALMIYTKLDNITEFSDLFDF